MLQLQTILALMKNANGHYSRLRYKQTKRKVYEQLKGILHPKLGLKWGFRGENIKCGMKKQRTKL